MVMALTWMIFDLNRFLEGGLGGRGYLTSSCTRSDLSRSCAMSLCVMVAVETPLIPTTTSPALRTSHRCAQVPGTSSMTAAVTLAFYQLTSWIAIQGEIWNSSLISWSVKYSTSEGDQGEHKPQPHVPVITGSTP